MNEFVKYLKAWVGGMFLVIALASIFVAPFKDASIQQTMMTASFLISGAILVK